MAKTFTVKVTKEVDKMLNIVIQMAKYMSSFDDTLQYEGFEEEVREFAQMMHEGVKKMPWCNFRGCVGG